MTRSDCALTWPLCVPLCDITNLNQGALGYLLVLRVIPRRYRKTVGYCFEVTVGGYPMMRSAHSGLAYEDPLTYLPRKPVQEYAKGRVIYDAQTPPGDLYVVILGRVKISTTAEDGCQTVGRIVRAEGLFG